MVRWRKIYNLEYFCRQCYVYSTVQVMFCLFSMLPVLYSYAYVAQLIQVTVSFWVVITVPKYIYFSISEIVYNSNCKHTVDRKLSFVNQSTKYNSRTLCFQYI